MGTQIEPPLVLQKPLCIPNKLLMGPGPSNCPPEILNAAGQPMLGHLDEVFLQIMEETKMGIKYAFQTNNEMTFAISGTGHSAMEAAICNIMEPNEEFLCITHGIWGKRALEIATRIGASSHELCLPIGEVITLDDIHAIILKLKPSLLFICHGDSSTGTLQPLKGIGDVCHKYGCLLLVDAVASLGGSPLFMDDYGIDILYTSSQKVLNAPPGISPISFSSRAIGKIKSRKTPVKSFYMDALLLGNYWNCDENNIRYHHTGPINLIYALREALSLLAKETLEQSWEKHRACAEELHKGLEELGLKLLVPKKENRLPTITAVKIPEEVSGLDVIRYVGKRFGLDIAGGLGPTSGMIWRIGLMGYNCTPKNVKFCLEAIKAALNDKKMQSNL